MIKDHFAYKIPYGAKFLCIIFDTLDGYIKKYDKARNLVLFHSEKSHRICDKNKYLIRLKSNISAVYSHNTTSKIHSDDNLSPEKIENMHNVVIFIKSIFSEDHNYYYYQVF